MPYPDKPTISTSYTAKAQALGNGSLPGTEMDVDFEALRNAIDTLNDFVRGVTRSDGRLANASVRKETLAADVLIGFDAPTAWETATAYVAQDTVFESNKFYICLTSHTSSVFADDLASGRWQILADFTTVTSAAEAARDAAVAAYDSFDDRYLGAKMSDPALDNDGAALLNGALYFNSVTGAMRVYNTAGGGSWSDVSNNSPIQTYRYTATAGQTAFTGNDVGGSSLQYDVGFESVFLNGVRLVPVVDYARTNSSTITLTAGANLNDVLVVVAQAGFTAIELANLAQAQTVSGNWNFTGQLQIGGTQVTASAAELNQLDGTTITAAGKALLDDADAAAQRTTLGAQAADATLTSLSGLSLEAGDILYATAADTLARLAKGTAGQVLQMNSGATAPEWVADGWATAGPIATTSGTAIDFTSIPADVSQIEVIFDSVSTDGATDILVQIGTGGTPATSGYETGSTRSGVVPTSTAGFIVATTLSIALTGLMRLQRVPGTNRWISTSYFRHDGGAGNASTEGAGVKAIAGALDILRLTTVSGSANFDGGDVSIRYL